MTEVRPRSTIIPFDEYRVHLIVVCSYLSLRDLIHIIKRCKNVQEEVSAFNQQIFINQT